MTEREGLLQLWDESWSEGTWFASWSAALDGLTPAQAAWHPGPGRHSIWQLVHHVVFWRDVTLAILADRPRPDDAERERRNFEPPAVVTEDAWEASRHALERSHQALRAALADEAKPLDRLRYHVVHDANHLGQILYLRRMQDLPAIES